MMWGACAAVAAGNGGFVAGTAPDRRPDGAPRIEVFKQTPEWQAAATTGISRPLPPSLKFLENQGAWFNPFTHRGMTGPYDIRGWYASKSASGSKSEQPK